MKLTDFATLPLAQAYVDIIDTKKVGSGQARSYLVNTNDLWKTLKLIQADITHDLFSLADAIITTASDAQSYFGMDATKADGIANRAGLDTLVTSTIMTQTEANGFLDMILSKSKPFANATEADWDAQVALDLVSGSVDAHTVKYGETDDNYVIKQLGRDLKFFVVFDTPPPLDCVVNIFVWEQATTALQHSKFPQAINVMRVKSGDVSTSDLCTKNFKRKIKFSATCNYNLPFMLHVND